MLSLGYIRNEGETMSYTSLEQEKAYKMLVTGTELEPVSCTFYVWSRGNAELSRETIVVSSYTEAKQIASEKLKTVPQAYSCQFYMPEYWNHNLTKGWGEWA